ncbi:hypothetical protein C84B14_15773 [Salinisphaera sp. C84B14]|tara:strand:- start:310 stop:681 length:372 start_codon:yes stop_codon:yes gene_type:complete
MLPLLAAGGLCLPLPALADRTPAHDYPTQARVEYAYECMNRLGGENYDTLYKCSCSIDYIADRLPYDEYVTLDTYQRGQNAAGERPEVLREGSIARESRNRLAAIKAQAAQQCLIEPSTGTRD